MFSISRMIAGVIPLQTRHAQRGGGGSPNQPSTYATREGLGHAVGHGDGVGGWRGEGCTATQTKPKPNPDTHFRLSISVALATSTSTVSDERWWMSALAASLTSMSQVSSSHIPSKSPASSCAYFPGGPTALAWSAL